MSKVARENAQSNSRHAKSRSQALREPKRYLKGPNDHLPSPRDNDWLHASKRHIQKIGSFCKVQGQPYDEAHYESTY